MKAVTYFVGYALSSGVMPFLVWLVGGDRYDLLFAALLGPVVGLVVLAFVVAILEQPWDGGCE